MAGVCGRYGGSSVAPGQLVAGIDYMVLDDEPKAIELPIEEGQFDSQS